MFKASCCYSVISNNELVIFLEEYYNIKNIESLHLHRAWIGDVYLFKDDKQSYVLKIYKGLTLHKRNAEISTDVIEYLLEKGITVPKCLKTKITPTQPLYLHQKENVKSSLQVLLMEIQFSDHITTKFITWLAEKLHKCV